MIFDTHANVLSHIVKKRLEGNRGIVDEYHVPEQLEGFVTGGIWTYLSELQMDLNESVTYILEELEESDNVQLVRSTDDWNEESLNIILGLQGLALITDIEHLEHIYGLGFRHASLTKDINELNHFVKEGHGGLTDLGQALIKKMNQLGMIIDLSGLKKSVMAHIFKITTGPIIASCSNCYALTPDPNNLMDKELRIIAETDGFVGVTTTGKLVSKPTVSALVDHIDYLKKLIGVRHISLGLNFMNYLKPNSHHLDECNNVRQATTIIDELYERNYSSFEVESIASANAKRVIYKILEN